MQIFFKLLINKYHSTHYIHIQLYKYKYIYSQLPISRTRKGPGKVSDLTRYPTYPRLKISFK